MKKVWWVAIALAVVIVAGGAYYLGTRGNKSAKTNTTAPAVKTDTSNKAAPPNGASQTVQQLQPDSLTYKDFASSDGIINAKYPTTWNKSEVGDINTVAPKSIVDKYKLLMPLLVSFGNQQKFAQFSVTRFVFTSDKSAAENVRELTKDVEATGFKVQTLNEKALKNDVYLLDSLYQKDTAKLHTKEKYFFLKENSQLVGYVASFQTYEQDWPEFSNVGDYLLDAVLIKGVDSTNASVSQITSGTVSVIPSVSNK